MIYEHELENPAAGFRNDYERAKHAAERHVRGAFERGLSGAIFRPAFVVSDTPACKCGDLVALLLHAVDAARDRDAPLILRMPATAGVNAVTIEWVTQTLLSLARFCGGRTYHLSAKDEVSINDFLNAARASGVELREAARSFDRLMDRMLDPFRPYFDARVEFRQGQSGVGRTGSCCGVGS